MMKNPHSMMHDPSTVHNGRHKRNYKKKKTYQYRQVVKTLDSSSFDDVVAPLMAKAMWRMQWQ